MPTADTAVTVHAAVDRVADRGGDGGAGDLDDGHA